ncbi:MAG: hypothetical protein PHG36_06330, partial [Dehalococcoidia bacterium]|nr:hypothetical protein [Dehalococcoidia bacterium]
MHCITVRSALYALAAFMLLSVAVPDSIFAYKPVIPLQVDVWCSKGGQGPGSSGGTYILGEIPVIYFTVNRSCQTKLMLSGPGGSNSWAQSADYGKTYQKQLGVAEESDAGTWQVMLQATSGNEVAQDITSFIIATPAIPTTIPSTTPSSPSPSSPQTAGPEVTDIQTPSTSTTSTPTISITDTAVNSFTATELDAFKALKMARNTMPVDLKLDTNGDHKITIEDARTILKWSVTGYGGSVSPAQKEIINAFGYPEQFSISYLLDSVIEYNALVRSEVWSYPEHQKKITFVGGEIYATDDLTPSPIAASSCSALKPEDFDYFMGYEEIADKIGGKVAKTDFLPETFQENNVESYLGKNVMFIIADGHLMHLQTFCTELEQVSINSGWTSGLVTQLNPFTPAPVSARGLWSAIKKGARFLVNLPQKVTGALLPRQLAPFAAAYLELQMGNFGAWRTASRLNDLGQLDDSARKARDALRSEA